MILAHVAGGSGDLPVEPWLLAYAAAFALLITFAALRVLWLRPRLAEAGPGSLLPGWADAVVAVLGVVGQGLALVLFATVLAAAWFGEDVASANLAPIALVVALWIGMQVASAVLGDVWRRVNPLWTLSAALDRIRGRDPAASTATGWWASHWPAAVGLLAFHWLQLAYAEPSSITAVAAFLSLYTVAVLVAASWFGAGWVRTGDGFAVLFGLLAALSPLCRDQRGNLRLRVPGAGLGSVRLQAGTLGVLFVVLGGAAFDGVTESQLWSDVVGARRGWELTAVNTAGLVLTIATVAVAYLVAVRGVGLLAGDDVDLADQARRWGHALIPVALGFSIAHHFSQLVFEGQGLLALLSDPLGSGRDLFGTAGNTIDLTVLTAGQVAAVQVAAIVIGHVAALIVAHDRALERDPHRAAASSLYPVLAVLVGYAVSGVLLLVGV